MGETNQAPRRIEVKVKIVYGRERVYPANESARLLCEMLNTKTLDVKVLKTMKALGHEVVQVTEAQDFLENLGKRGV